RIVPGAATAEGVTGYGLFEAARLAGFDNPADYVNSYGFASVQDYVIAEIRSAQDTYPTLRYVVYRPGEEARFIEQFTNRLKAMANGGQLPHQLTDVEVARLPGTEFAALDDKMTNTFTFGFKPDRQFHMGLVDGGDGKYIRFDVWNDHVATTAPGYRV